MTAAASIVLAMVVGAAALYLASPLSHRDGGGPETAVVAVPPGSPEPTDETGAVSGISLGLEAVSAPDVEKQPEAAEPDPVSQPEPDIAAAPAPEPEVVEAPEPEPEIVEAPEPGIVEAAPPKLVQEPESAPELSTTAPVTPATITQPEPVAPVYDGGWVCSDAIVIEDSRVRDWSLGRVSFRPRNGFDRVVLHLDRAGNGSGDPASITAGSMGSWKVKGNIPGADRPGLGRRSITLQLDGGFSGSLALRGYRPSGLGIIKEFSTYPAGRDGRNVVISADTDGCYRVRVPAWNDPSGSLRRAEIHVDIKP